MNPRGTPASGNDNLWADVEEGIIIHVSDEGAKGLYNLSNFDRKPLEVKIQEM